MKFSPFAFGFSGEVNAGKMKPLDGALENETQGEYKEQAETDNP